MLHAFSHRDPQTRLYFPLFHDLETVLPEANLVRLVGILWDNGNPNKACRTDDASHGFLSEECVQQMDAAITACQKHKTWVIITCRAAEAAGDGYPNDVFHDEDLAAQYETMWRLVMYLLFISETTLFVTDVILLPI